MLKGGKLLSPFNINNNLNSGVGKLNKVTKILSVVLLIVSMLCITIIAIGPKLLIISGIWVLLLIYFEKFINMG